MIHILLYDDRPDFIKRFKLKALTHLKATIIAKSKVSEATEILGFVPNIKLIAGKESEAKSIQMLKVYADAKGERTPSMVYKEDESDAQIIKRMANILNVEVKLSILAQNDDHNYVPIPVRDIQELETPCDIYIKIGKKEASNQFVKRVNAFDLIDDNLFAKLLSFSVDNVYIHKEDYEIFYTALTNKMVRGLTEDAPIDQKINFQFEAYQYIIQYSDQLKFDKHTLDIIENVVGSVKETIVKQRSLSELITRIVSKKDSLSFQTFYLTNLMVSYLIRRDEELKQSNLEAAVMASLFSDFGLDARNTFFINSEVELEEAREKIKLSKEEYELIRTHAKRNSSFLASYPGINSTVLSLIKEHHGSEIGVGFNDKPGDSIKKLSKIFMVGNTFIKYFMNPIYRFNKKAIIEKMLLRFANDADLKHLASQLSQKIE